GPLGRHAARGDARVRIVRGRGDVRDRLLRVPGQGHPRERGEAVDPARGVATGPVSAGPAYESQVAVDLARRAAFVAPVVVLALGIARGVDGAASAAIALILVALNFLLAARLVAWAAGKSVSAVYGTVMGGYVLRLGALLGLVVGLVRLAGFSIPVLV